VVRIGNPGPDRKPGGAHRAVPTHLAVRTVGIDVTPRIGERRIVSRRVGQHHDAVRTDRDPMPTHRAREGRDVQPAQYP